jgi:hypothetical protein
MQLICTAIVGGKWSISRVVMQLIARRRATALTMARFQDRNERSRRCTPNNSAYDLCVHRAAAIEHCPDLVLGLTARLEHAVDWETDRREGFFFYPNPFPLRVEFAATVP